MFLPLSPSPKTGPGSMLSAARLTKISCARSMRSPPNWTDRSSISWSADRPRMPYRLTAWAGPKHPLQSKQSAVARAKTSSTAFTPPPPSSCLITTALPIAPRPHSGEGSRRRRSSVRLRCSRKFYAASPCRASDGNQAIGAGVGGTVGRL